MWIQMTITIICSVLASSGFWAYIQKRSDKPSFAVHRNSLHGGKYKQVGSSYALIIVSLTKYLEYKYKFAKE